MPTLTLEELYEQTYPANTRVHNIGSAIRFERKAGNNREWAKIGFTWTTEIGAEANYTIKIVKDAKTDVVTIEDRDDMREESFTDFRVPVSYNVVDGDGLRMSERGIVGWLRARDYSCEDLAGMSGHDVWCRYVEPLHTKK